MSKQWREGMVTVTRCSRCEGPLPATYYIQPDDEYAFTVLCASCVEFLDGLDGERE